MQSYEPDLARVEDGYFNIASNFGGLQPHPVVVAFDKESWVSDESTFNRNRYVNPLVHCPIQTYINKNHNKCVRDSMKSVKVLALKSQADGAMTITSNFT